MKTLIFKIFIFITIITPIFAQWQPDVRLTNDISSSWTSRNYAWCIKASGDSVHVVWYDNRNGNNEIYYKRSTDRGLTWGVDTRLTNATGESWNPSISVSGSIVCVVWQDNRDGNYEVYYKHSTNGGTNWGTDTRLTNNNAYSVGPSVVVSGSNVHIVWIDNRDGNDEIYYKRSTDRGLTWGADTRLTNATHYSWYPSISVSSSTVCVVWEDVRDWNCEIYYKHSIDEGTNWGTDTRLTNDTFYSTNPSASVSGSNVHVVWSDSRDGNIEIYYKRSTDGGITWGTDTRLTNNTGYSRYASISVSGLFVHIVWQDGLMGPYDEIYYKRSTDGGVSWESTTQLTNATESSVYPSLSVSDSTLHVVWTDKRDGNYEIYYKRNPTGNPSEIKQISLEIPNKYVLYQNYPNPFNPVSKIKFDVARAGILKLTILDILGREILIIVNTELKPGTYETVFDGTNYPSGVYFYKLESETFTQTKKMVLIK